MFLPSGTHPQKDAQEEKEILGAGGEVYTWQILAHGKGWKHDLNMLASAPPTLTGCSHQWHPVPLWGSLRRHTLILGLGRGAGLQGWRERDSGVCRLARDAEWGDTGFELISWLSHIPDVGRQGQGFDVCVNWGAREYGKASKEERKRGGHRG